MEPATSDWSMISTDDLITISEAWNYRIENQDGSCTLPLNSVHASRFMGLVYEVSYEMHKRDEERFEKES